MALGIPFNRPLVLGGERAAIEQVLRAGVLSGHGPFGARAEAWLEHRTGSRRALLTPSCTAALELAALALDLRPGDEVVMPSFTFVSTASAFALRGAIPVFADIRADTQNLDPEDVLRVITPRTRAIVPVHYAGIACDMDRIDAIAQAHRLAVVEDAAHSILASWRGRALGSLGDLGTLSFHETKNLTCGEGGALLVNRGELLADAEVRRDKGTDRGAFRRGDVDFYSWQSLGSSFALGELAAACLVAQLDAADAVTTARVGLWEHYHRLLEPLEARGWLQRPVLPPGCRHNGHLYYVLLPIELDRGRVLRDLLERGVECHFHYQPLHASTGGRRWGRTPHPLPVTTRNAARLVRLPLWYGLAPGDQERVVDTLESVLRQARPRPALLPLH